MGLTYTVLSNIVTVKVTHREIQNFVPKVFHSANAYTMSQYVFSNLPCRLFETKQDLPLLLTYDLNSQVFGRAIKNEYLSLGTIITAAVVAYGSMSGGKKEAAPSGSSLKETIEKAKETIPLGAGSRYVTIVLFAYKARLLKEFLQ